MDVKVISAVKDIKTPIALLALVVVVAEGILVAILARAQGADFTLVIAGFVLLPFACLVVLYLLYRRPGAMDPSLAVKDEVPAPSGRTYDLFVSVPMASFASDAEYQAFRTTIVEVVKSVKKHCGFRDVFYAGGEIERLADFESEDLSINEDYDACVRSRYFVLIYPQRIASSALIELGWAMALRKPILIFTKSRADLPFLAKNADAVFKNLRIFEFQTEADITQRFEANGPQLFAQLDAATKGP